MTCMETGKQVEMFLFLLESAGVFCDSLMYCGTSNADGGV